MGKRLIAMAAMVAALPVLSTSASTPEQKGLDIALQAEAKGNGFVDSKAELEMVLINARGEENHRKLRQMTLEGADSDDKSLMVFLSPKDQKGTALLTHASKDDDEQWLYLPAVKRVKRIVSRNKSGPFVGSEFSYEDLNPQNVDDYTYKYLREEPCSDDPAALACHVMEQFPLDKHSGYSRLVVWLDQDELRLQKIDFYDRKDSLLKTMTASGYQQYNDQFWRPENSLMVNHQTGKSTRLLFSSYAFGSGLKERDFTKNSLKRAR
ncbi:outer membrane lipoprotein-sorting protein [Kistimonas asteriae]|uniref:outer membrane lipoprotein-sorting protein n=1 Tax=Kistimonas asteriae TaxID=517724 RepID=UPI001BAE4847|nr:outer membrane lipoprotein-sorting protein [Kistimonas asteriae]